MDARQMHLGMTGANKMNPPSINLETIKKWLTFVISVVALIVSVLTAINGALPNQIGEPPIAVTNQGVSNLDTLQVGDGSLTEAAFGFTADPDNGLYRVGANNIGIVAGGTKIIDVTSSGASIVGTFGLSGVTFSGVAKWGSSATYTSGSSISHGFTTTPTVCLMEPARDVTSTLTITATGFSSNRATQATPIYWICGQ